MLFNEPKMKILCCLFLPPLKVRSKMLNSRFPAKVTLRLKKVGYKVSLFEYCQRQICKAFTGLSICAKVVCRGRPVLCESLAETDQPPSKTWISKQYLLIAPQP